MLFQPEGMSLRSFKCCWSGHRCTECHDLGRSTEKDHIAAPVAASVTINAFERLSFAHVQLHKTALHIFWILCTLQHHAFGHGHLLFTNAEVIVDLQEQPLRVLRRLPIRAANAGRMKLPRKPRAHLSPVRQTQATQGALLCTQADCIGSDNSSLQLTTPGLHSLETDSKSSRGRL